ncbi:MAG: BMP family lipoprotein [Mycoplasmatales bacterium]
MKRILGLLAIAIVVLAGCANGSSSVDCKTVDKSDITMVSDTGGINDKSFNQGTWEGVQKYCAEAGVTAAFIETTSESQYIPNLTIAAENSKVVVGAGFTFEKPMYEVASKFPDVKFVLIDGQPTNSNDEKVELDNVQSYFFDEAQAGYLAGFITGKTTTTNKVGFIGGMEIPPVQKFGWGYLQGIQDANPDVVVDYQYAGDFSNSALGKTLADAMYNGGGDIIFTAAGGTNTGVVEASKSLVLNGKIAWVVGVDRDMYEDGTYTSDNETKSVILTSAVKNVGTASYDGVKAALEGNWKGGVFTLSYEDAAVGLPKTNPNLEESLIEEAAKSLEGKKDLKSKNANEVKEALNIKVNGNI